MKPSVRIAAVLALAFLAACSHITGGSQTAKPTALGTAIVESSGGKQVASVGATLPQAIIVQVNDEQSNGVPGAWVELSGAPGVHFDPPSGLTDSSGQFTSNVSLAGMAGRYEITATTLNKQKKPVHLTLQEIALGYEQMLGKQLNDQYCDRCHNPESTPERVSNYDNLEVKPHPFTEGETLNKMSDSDLLAIITHGGAALNKSPLMPPYGYTLGKSDIQALIAYLRAVSDPAYQPTNLVFAKSQ